MILKRFLFLALLLALSVSRMYAQSYKGDSWQSIKEKKAGKIYILHYDRPPYVYVDEERGQLTGIEYDMTNEMVRYLKKEYDLELEVEIIKFDDFKLLYEALKKSEGGVIGLTSMPADEIPESGIQFSPAFMPDIEVIGSSANMTVATDKGQLRSALNGSTPVTVAGSHFEADLNKIKDEYFPESKYEYVDDQSQVTERIIKGSGVFGYIPLTEYYIALKHGREIKKQNFFEVKRADFKLIYPASSDWTEPINEYFSNNKFKPTVNFIIKKHLGTDVTGLLWEMPNAADSEKKLSQAEHDAATSQQELQFEYHEFENFRRSTLVAAGVFILGLAGMGFWKYKSDKSNKTLIARKEKELVECRTELTEVSARADDALDFARHIQEAALPTNEKLKEIFPESFVYYQPRDVVSGDFYWFAEKGDEKIVALFDSTGQGIAAALVTMQAVAILKEIVLQKNITEPAAILNELDRRLPEIIVHIGLDFIDKDGIEAAVCTINTAKQTISFAGAKEPLYFFSGGRLLQQKGSKFDIGNSFFKEKIFEPVTLSYKPGDVFYLSSDGYADQLGSDQKSRFLVKNFKEMLLEIHDQPMTNQFAEFQRRFSDWKKNIKQTDDVAVIGIKLQ